MPALLLVLRFGRMPFPLPLPWFPVWLVLLPLAILGQFVGSVSAVLARKRSDTLVLLSASMAAWSLITRLHGLEITVRSEKENLQFMFI